MTTYDSRVVCCLGDGSRVKAQTLAALANNVGSETEELALLEHVSVRCLCFCFSGIVRAGLVVCCFYGLVTRWGFRKLKCFWVCESGTCLPHCRFVGVGRFVDGRQMQVIVAEDRAFSSLRAEGLVGQIILGVTGGCSRLNIAGRLGEGTGSDDGQESGKDGKELHF